MYLLSLTTFTRCVRKLSDLRSYLRVGAILRHPDRGILRSSLHLIEPHAPSGACTSLGSPRTQILEWPLARASHYSESSRCRRTAFLWAPFSILGTSKSLRELCRDCTEAGEAVQSCVTPKIAVQGSMNALARYRGEEASAAMLHKNFLAPLDQKRGRFLLTASRNLFRTST